MDTEIPAPDVLDMEEKDFKNLSDCFLPGKVVSCFKRNAVRYVLVLKLSHDNCHVDCY